MVEDIEAWECPECDELHEDREGADSCCIRDIYEVDAYKCSCGNIYREESGAANCCDDKEEIDNNCPHCDEEDNFLEITKNKRYCNKCGKTWVKE